MTPKAISGSRRNYIGQAKYAARLAERALAELGLGHHTVEPALAFWGPGAPAIEGGSATIQGTLVIEGSRESAWRKALRGRDHVLDQQEIESIVALLRGLVAEGRAT